MLGPDEQVFEVEAGLAAKRREVEEVEREADGLAVFLGDQGLGVGAIAEEAAADVVGRGLRRVFQLLVDGQLADQVRDRLGNRRPGGADGGGHASACPVGVFEAHVDAVSVRRQPLLVGQHADVGGEPREALAVDVDEAGPLEEVVRREARGPSRGAPGGQDVRGAGGVVAHGHGRVVAEEDRAGVRSGDRPGGRRRTWRRGGARARWRCSARRPRPRRGPGSGRRSVRGSRARGRPG